MSPRGDLFRDVRWIRAQTSARLDTQRDRLVGHSILRSICVRPPRTVSGSIEERVRSRYVKRQVRPRVGRWIVPPLGRDGAHQRVAANALSVVVVVYELVLV